MPQWEEGNAATTDTSWWQPLLHPRLSQLQHLSIHPPVRLRGCEVETELRARRGPGVYLQFTDCFLSVVPHDPPFCLWSGWRRSGLQGRIWPFMGCFAHHLRHFYGKWPHVFTLTECMDRTLRLSFSLQFHSSAYPVVALGLLHMRSLQRWFENRQPHHDDLQQQAGNPFCCNVKAGREPAWGLWAPVVFEGSPRARSGQQGCRQRCGTQSYILSKYYYKYDFIQIHKSFWHYLWFDERSGENQQLLRVTLT